MNNINKYLVFSQNWQRHFIIIWLTMDVTFLFRNTVKLLMKLMKFEPFIKIASGALKLLIYWVLHFMLDCIKTSKILLN